MLQAPHPLNAQHTLDDFDCGIASLNQWLRRRAGSNQANGAARTFVATEGDRVVAYYALASSAVEGSAAPGRFRRNMPELIPVVLLGRLAVAMSHQGRGLGRAMFQDAGKRVLFAADTIGIRGLLVHAMSEQARVFYTQLGLGASPLDPMTLMVTMSDLATALSD